MQNMDFIYMNEDLIDCHLKCRMCTKPFIDPVITRDNDRFCRLCIVQSLVNTSNINLQSSFVENLVSIEEKLLHEMLDNLLVKCPDCQKINIRRIDLKQHLLTECPKRIVLCQACDLKCPWSGTYDQYDDHVRQCTFQLLRPILNETFQYQKQLEEYRRSFISQQNEIEQLKKQITQYDQRSEKLEKGFRAILDLNSKKQNPYEKFQNDLEDIQRQFAEHNHQQNEIREDIQQLKEQISNLFQEFQQYKTQLPNTDAQQSNQLNNDIQQMKEQFNQYELTIQEQNSNRNNQIKELQKQDLYRKNEVIHLRQISDQHEIQIRLLARKKCLIPRSILDNDSRIVRLVETVTSNSEVDLDGKHFDTQDMESICKTAIMDQKCRKLRLENNDINAKGINILADTLYGNTTLVELHLSNNSISDMGAHALAQVLSINNSTLSWLEIHANHITDEGAEHLAEMLKTNKTLILLGLSFNQISDCGVRHLASAITYYNDTLQWLHLASNKFITDASVENLVDMITHNRSLQALWLNDCSLSTDAKKKLKQAAELNKNFILEV